MRRRRQALLISCLLAGFITGCALPIPDKRTTSTALDETEADATWRAQAWRAHLTQNRGAL